MRNQTTVAPTRRRFLAGTAAAALLSGLSTAFPKPSHAALREIRLRAAPGAARLVPAPYPDTQVWSYGSVPGPEIRVRQGERLRVVVENALVEETTVHWHGMRVPNAMDGVPHLTQQPIAPGESFIYEFDAVDAGTFWYHPHQNGAVQVGRGLYGPLIVEEAEPVAVDRDVTWVLDDWRLLGDASISGGFGNMMDTGMAGRIGKTVTVNGRVPETFAVRAGERIRLRLINAANPSLTDLWERPAGKAEGFARYSAGLKAADFHWDTAVLDAWLADPRAMIPDTRMVFRGIAEAQERADLVAFLAVAMAPNGADAVIERGFAPPGYARGQKPEPLTPTPPGVRVTRIRHCGDSYFVTATDGAETAHWEMSVRLKLDARDTGPAAGAPVIVGAGMMGDRVSIVFASLRDLNSLLEEAC